MSFETAINILLPISLICVALLVIDAMIKLRKKKQTSAPQHRSIKQVAAAIRPVVVPPKPVASTPGKKPQDIILDLNIGAFRPLSDAETKAAAVGLQWGAFAFGLQ